MARLKVETNTWIDQEIQADGRGRESVKEAGHTFGFGNGDHGPIDLSIPSNGTSQGSGEWDLVFDFKPSSFAQDDLFLGSYSLSKKNDADTGSHVSQVVKNVDSNENFWHFKAAYSETQPIPPSEAAGIATPVDLERHATTDFFTEPKESFHNSGDWNSAFTFNPLSVTGGGIISDSYTSGKKNDIARVTSSPDDNHDESDDNVWEFKDAITETGTKHEGELVISHSFSAGVPPAFDSKIQNKRKALPLSLFGDEELETDESSIHQDVSNIPAFLSTNSIKTPASTLSVNDLISSLYSRVEHNTYENHTPIVSENGMYSATKVVEPDLVKHDDDSWEFKDAFTNSLVQDQTSITCIEDSSAKSSTKLQLNDCLEFYSKLKDESCFVAMGHPENLKKAQSSAILSGEEAKAKALGEEFQEVYNQLRQDNMTFNEFQLENLSPRNTCLSELLEVLLEPKFKVLESEYQLSEQLSLIMKTIFFKDSAVSYRESLKLSPLTKNDKADCLADQIENQPRTTITSTGNIVRSCRLKSLTTPNLIKKCKINVHTTTDRAIMAVCVHKLVPTLVLTNYTRSQYAKQLNNSKYTRVGVGSEDDWMVVILTTSTHTGSFASAAISWVSKVALVHYLPPILLGFVTVFGELMCLP